VGGCCGAGSSKKSLMKNKIGIDEIKVVRRMEFHDEMNCGMN
jgi:hypothetical protein